jgi:hypothetical protein
VIKVTPNARTGMVIISPPGHGGMEVPPTRLRLPGGVNIEVRPQGEGALYTPVALQLGVILIDQATGRDTLAPASTPNWPGGLPDWVTRVGDWRYDVISLDLFAATVPGGINPRDLVAIRLPGLLRRALRPLVMVLGPDDGFTIDGDDPDERAIAAYVTAQLVRDNPTQAVAAELGINANAAGQRVFRLRRAGRLPASKRGKQPCPDGPYPSVSSLPAAGRPAPPVSTQPPSTATTRPKRGRSSS